jgi:predicted small lipoprotein YifL
MHMKNTLLMFAFLITVVGLTGCSSPTTPTPTDDMAVVEDNMDENMGDSDEAMDDEDM